MKKKNMSITEVLQKATGCLLKSSTPRLDAEVLLAHILKKERSYLYAYPDLKLSEQEKKQFENLVKRREKGEPISYLIGYREFWSLDLCVTKDTLIPRPETELLVETTLNLLPASEKLCVVDLGTGSGAIALALATERPNWHIIGTDCSAAAISVAEKNARQLALKNIDFFVSDWFSKISHYQFDAIVSNPPYLAVDDIHLDQSEINFEPREALVSGADGLNSIRTIVSQSVLYLKPQGLLLLEHGCTQGFQVKNILSQNQYRNIITIKDLLKLERVSYGRK